MYEERNGAAGLGRIFRYIAIGVCAVVIIAMFQAVVRSQWSSVSADARTISHERHGVAYMHGMMALIGDLVETQSAAVRGANVDPSAVRTALDEVNERDQKYGVELGTRQRFADLRNQAEQALSTSGTPRAVYQTYSNVVGLAVALAGQVGDASQLIHDESLDSYYVMSSALISVPDAIVNAGRATDLVTLAGNRQLGGDDAIRAAVARYSVATDGQDVTIGINKSVDATSLASLGTDIAPQLDAFRSAVDSFSPPTMLAQLAGAVDAAQLASGAHQVFAKAVPLGHKLLSELDKLLALRQESIAGTQRLVRTAVIASSVAGLVMLILVLWGLRRRSARAERRQEPPTGVTTDLSGLLRTNAWVTTGATTRFGSGEQGNAG